MKAVNENPIFSTSPDRSRLVIEHSELLHIALVKIRGPQLINERTLQGVCHTLSQLNQLGLSCIVVVDPKDGREVEVHEAKVATAQADRIVDSIETYGGQRARRLDSVVGVSTVEEKALSSIKIRGTAKITDRELLLFPLCRGVIPVIVPVGFNPALQLIAPVDADEVVLALTREFAGLQSNASVERSAEDVEHNHRTPQRQVSVDRLIVLDPLGGIPANDREHSSHVFINLEQELSTIMSELRRTKLFPLDAVNSESSFPENGASVAATSNRTMSQTAAEERLKHGTKLKHEKHVESLSRVNKSEDIRVHVQNLELMNHALALLPPSSSGFLTTPEAVANSQSRPPLASQGPRVRTRRQRNPLIHNLLTDKPVVSSSLPANRLRDPKKPLTPAAATAASPATFFKRGMPLSIIPNSIPWVAPSVANPSLNLSHHLIDLPRLTHLIDDSFSRKLDVTHYLNRIRDRVAGIIIAGEYEGGAVLTWETPPGIAADDRERMVPYLDKFAVLRRSQGAGGVADIVFKAMVLGSFPNGVCWRSRKNNPVNKWYFERAKGTWKIPGSDWTMFWTTEGVETKETLLSDYTGVCRTVEPSWADNRSPD